MGINFNPLRLTIIDSKTGKEIEPQDQFPCSDDELKDKCENVWNYLQKHEKLKKKCKLSRKNKKRRQRKNKNKNINKQNTRTFWRKPNKNKNKNWRKKNKLKQGQTLIK
jgi:hypothetical protein